jgi:hypothetical protein
VAYDQQQPIERFCIVISLVTADGSIAPSLLIQAVLRFYGDHNNSRISAVLFFREKEEFDDPFRPRGGDCIYVRGTSISCSIDRIIDLGGDWLLTTTSHQWF